MPSTAKKRQTESCCAWDNSPCRRNRARLVRWRKSFDGSRSRRRTRVTHHRSLGTGADGFGYARTGHPAGGTSDAGRVGVPRCRLLDLIRSGDVGHRQSSWLRHLLRTRSFERQPTLGFRLSHIGSTGAGRAVFLGAHTARVHPLAHHSTLQAIFRSGHRLESTEPFPLPVSLSGGCSLVSSCRWALRSSPNRRSVCPLTPSCRRTNSRLRSWRCSPSSLPPSSRSYSFAASCSLPL